MLTDDIKDEVLKFNEWHKTKNEENKDVLTQGNLVTDDGQKIDIDTLNLLSSDGSEVLVYHDDNLTYKIFRDNYRFTHKTSDELDYLASLKTSRILMPKQKLFQDDKLVGFTMKYISNAKNVLNDPMSHFIEELSILANDVELISQAGIRLLDLTKSNIVYDGGIYLIDFGNYKINENDDMFYDMNGKKCFIDNSSQSLVAVDDYENQTMQYFIKKWNYTKINSLIYEMLFTDNPDIDFYVLRKILEFFTKQRKSQDDFYDINVYKQYFNKDLTVGCAIQDFIANNIQIDRDEKDALMSLLEQ